MSLEYYAFIPAEADLTRETWEASAQALGVALRFDTRFEPRNAKGFCPIEIDGKKSGCEIDFNLEPVDELKGAFPKLRDQLGNGVDVISFRIGGDMLGLACLQASAAALVERFRGVFYDPQENEVIVDQVRMINEVLGTLKLAGINGKPA